MDLSALHKITYGIYIVASELDGKPNGQVVNSLIQVTSTPPRLLACINKGNLTHEFIEKSGAFSVSVLSVDTPMKFLGTFGFKCGRDVDKFEGVTYKKGKTGAPIVTDNALCWFELKLVQAHDVGTHTLFVGEIVDAGVLRDGEPMTYAYYHEVKKGKVPKSAPHYAAQVAAGQPAVEDGRYRCKVCGYMYDPKDGDPEGGVKAGTRFEELPDDWACPLCGAAKSEFEKAD